MNSPVKGSSTEEGSDETDVNSNYTSLDNSSTAATGKEREREREQLVLKS